MSAVGQHLDAEISAAGDWDAAVVTLTAANGAVATIINSRHCATGYDQRLEAFGPLGSLELTNPTPAHVRHASADRSGAAGPYLAFFLERYADAYRAELDHFVQAVTSGRTPVPGLAEGRTALALADAATRSATTGGRVRPDGTLTTASAR
ncbi:Gfo/Idh/MocA family oxidoreductase [Cellulomonas sp. ATA003]|uniref:Gfo/Idh/MocA family oxidoreductase n=1 Tax=Cellulomonas sp. ATA003 TaxID=3073064 RepID=UPI002872FC07|nr:Gfo/Idh/MocA family oxidoreductase [Cellulomonas sp. ATA003]WNB87076.1 Gfo/Idh/MocA family oxidoreductase [Cellulomonas sp. ATA003]